MLISFAGCRSCPPKIVRLPIDAEADATSAVRLTDLKRLVSVTTRLSPATMTFYLREQRVDGKDAPKEQMHQLQAVRYLMLGAEVAHAVSWAWPNHAPDSSILVAEGMTRANMSSKTKSPLTTMLPTLRLRATRRGALLPMLSQDMCWLCVANPYLHCLVKGACCRLPLLPCLLYCVRSCGDGPRVSRYFPIVMQFVLVRRQRKGG